MYRTIILSLVLFVGCVNAHEWTPTYPKLAPSYVPGILRANMVLFNTRKDVRFYQLEVFDEEWNKVPFAANNKLVTIDYLQRKKIPVYIREKDKFRAVYVCTRSKLLAEGKSTAALSTRICSKIK
jgi:hypothetical protein